MVFDFTGLINTDLLDTYQAGIDYLIDNLGKTCKLVYPPKITSCPKCNADSVGRKASNFTQSGMPIPNFASSKCPACNGAGTKETVVTEDITTLIYWTPKEFIDLGVKIETPNTVIQMKGYLTDLPKVKKANEVIVLSNIEPYVRWKFKKLGEAVPQGFRQNRYFIQLWERIGG